MANMHLIIEIAFVGEVGRYPCVFPEAIVCLLITEISCSNHLNKCNNLPILFMWKYYGGRGLSNKVCHECPPKVKEVTLY